MMDGKKTYLVAGIGVLALVAVNVFGVAIPGMAPDPEWVIRCMELLGLMTLRAGVAKVGAA
jgi:hypothetical protein